MNQAGSGQWRLFIDHVDHLYDRYSKLLEGVRIKASEANGNERKELFKLRQILFIICSQLGLLQVAFKEYQNSGKAIDAREVSPEL